MAIVTRGFGRAHDAQDVPLPPGQHLADGFPVLTAGATQHVDDEDWSLTITTEIDERRTWAAREPSFAVSAATQSWPGSW